jgi:hypothetical protein
MKRFMMLLVLVLVGVVTWRLSERLSADAIGMALGVFLGILAGLPIALLVLAATRRRERQHNGWGDEGQAGQRRGAGMAACGYPNAMPQPPVIVLAGPGYPQQGQGAPQGQWATGSDLYNRPQLSPPGQHTIDMPQERRFKVVGEKEEWLEEW